MRELIWFLCSIGTGLLFAYIFPSLTGPFGLLKFLRETIGKPFSCAVCMAFWGTIASPFLLALLPFGLMLGVGAAGWVMFINHVSGYQPIFEGMEVLE